jgi:hypothetical protein
MIGIVRKKNTGEEIKEKENSLAKLIAAVVRDKMEDFRCKYLTDAQMQELNPIIREAIYKALVELQENPEGVDWYYQSYVPEYWEGCVLLDIKL